MLKPAPLFALCIAIVSCFAMSQTTNDNTPDTLQQQLVTAQGEQKLQLLEKLATYYSNSRNVNEGLPVVLEGLRMVQQYPNEAIQASLGLSAAQLFSMNKSYEKASDYFLRALDYYRKTNERFKEATALQGLGALNKIAGNYALSLQYNEQAKVIFEALDHTVGKLATVNNMAGTELLMVEQSLGVKAHQINPIDLSESEQQQLTTILSTYQEVVTLARDINPRYVGVFLFNVGMVQNYLGNSLNAIANLEEAAQIWQQVQSDEALIRTYSELAKAWFMQGDAARALSYIQSAETLATDNLQLQLVAIKYKVPVLLALNKTDDANLAFSNYKFISEKFNTENAQLRTEASNKLAEIRLKDQVIETLNLQNSLKVAELEKTNLKADKQLYGIMFLAGVAVLLAFLWRQRVRANRLISEHNAKLQQQALTDQLTGLYNRRAFEMYANQEQHRFERSGTPYSLALLDIDHFKTINDTFGHDTGDKVLKALAGTIRKTCRNLDILCRWGGEEFVILFSDTPQHLAVTVLERILHDVANTNLSILKGKQVTFSAGVVESGKDKDWQSMVKLADKALYEAKNTGRAKVVAA